MINSNINYTLLSLLLFSIVCNMYATPTDSLRTKKMIYQFELHQEINPSAARIALNAIENAEELKADYILLDLNTYGGYVSDADEIRTALIDTKIPTIVFIRNNAASAGALISIACDSIYMKKGATIGAAAVVNEYGEIMPEKYQSYMREKMRATAEATNKNPDIAEGMVDPRVEIEGVTTNDKIITFSVEEAIKNGYCNAETESIDSLLAIAKLEIYTIQHYKVSTTESVISFFVNPVVAGFLLLIIIGGIFFEMQSPGLGFPIVAAILAALFYFLPHYLEGLAANWEIVLFLIGLVLIALEVFVIPGFGITGVSGLIAIVTSLVLSLVRNIDGFEFGLVNKEQMIIALLTVGIVLISALLGFFFGGEKMMSLAFSNSSIGNTTSLRKEDDFVISGLKKLNALIGKEGVAKTDLRLSGKIAIENEWFDAISDSEFIEKDTQVKVLRITGATVVVEKV